MRVPKIHEDVCKEGKKRFSCSLNSSYRKGAFSILSESCTGRQTPRSGGLNSTTLHRNIAPTNQCTDILSSDSSNFDKNPSKAHSSVPLKPTAYSWVGSWQVPISFHRKNADCCSDCCSCATITATMLKSFGHRIKTLYHHTHCNNHCNNYETHAKTR
jgi:hypothetical protein